MFMNNLMQPFDQCFRNFMEAGFLIKETFNWLHIAGTYITVEVCVCAFSLVIRILILNMYHAPGDRPIPACLMAIARCGRKTKMVSISEDHDIKHNGSRVDPEPTPDNSQMRNIMKQHSGMPNIHTTRECRDVIANDITSESATGGWRRIARACDVFCFTSFLTFHILFIVAVVSITWNTIYSLVTHICVG